MNEDLMTRNILEKIRMISENTAHGKSMLNEADEKDDKKKESTEEKKKKLDAIAITNDVKFGSNALQNQIDEFHTSVDSGAQFTEPDEDNVSESPLIYMPSNGNVIFSGIIPCLNNLKFQFVLKTTTGNGCFIWSDGLILSKENIQLLNKLHGFYLNWKDQWNGESKDFKTLVDNMIKNQ